jgi:hypothetical protein
MLFIVNIIIYKQLSQIKYNARYCNCIPSVSVKLPSFPATEFHVSLYLIHLSDLRKSVSSINEVFYSISWTHKLAGVYNPCTSDFVLSVKEGVIRTVGHTIHKKSLWHQKFKTNCY